MDRSSQSSVSQICFESASISKTPSFIFLSFTVPKSRMLAQFLFFREHLFIRVTPEQMCVLIYQKSLVLNHDFLKIVKVKRKIFRDDKCIYPTNLRFLYKAMSV